MSRAHPNSQDIIPEFFGMQRALQLGMSEPRAHPNLQDIIPEFKMNSRGLL
jgi:hypothetical protein